MQPKFYYLIILLWRQSLFGRMVHNFSSMVVEENQSFALLNFLLWVINFWNIFIIGKQVKY